MAATNLGTVAIHGEGNWNASTAYTKLSVVADNGGSYMAITDVPAGMPLTNMAYWLPIAATAETVEAWLEEHPEMVTTVQNNSITSAKLHPMLRDEISGIGPRMDAAEDDISDNANDIRVLDGRVTVIESGASPASGELLGIRTGYDGTVYDGAGAAVRNQVRDLHAITDSVSEIANASKTTLKDTKHTMDAIHAAEIGLDSEEWEEYGYWSDDLEWKHTSSSYPFMSINRLIPTPDGCKHIVISSDIPDYQVKFIGHNTAGTIVSTGFIKLSTLPGERMIEALEGITDFTISLRYYVGSTATAIDLDNVHIKLVTDKSDALVYKLSYDYWSNTDFGTVIHPQSGVAYRDSSAIDCSKISMIKVSQASALNHRIRLIGKDAQGNVSYSRNIELDGHANSYTFDVRRSGWVQMHINLTRYDGSEYVDPDLDNLAITYVKASTDSVLDEINGLKIGAINHTYAVSGNSAPVKIALFGASIVVGQYGWDSSKHRNNVGDYGPYVTNGFGYYKFNVAPWNGANEHNYCYATVNETTKELIGHHWPALLHQHLLVNYPNNKFEFDNYAIGAANPENYYKMLSISDNGDATNPVHNYMYDHIRSIGHCSRAIAIVMLGNNGRKYTFEDNVSWNSKTLKLLKDIGYEVFCCTPTPALNTPSEAYINTYQVMQSFKYAAEIADVSSIDTFGYIIDYCDSHGISIRNTDRLDADSVCFLANDNLHPSKLGHSIIFKAIRSGLKI